ncbi:uncharacterized protein METZ01_LOCUS10904 [marine metagenome]|uniref:Uncharacterized protein n=1 Tax=marine metagenome TaxID=408172 RepID=A0A381NU10_9ZZZZ
MSVEGLSGPSQTGWYTDFRPKKREECCIGDEYRHGPSTLSSALIGLWRSQRLYRVVSGNGREPLSTCHNPRLCHLLQGKQPRRATERAGFCACLFS